MKIKSAESAAFIIAAAMSVFSLGGYLIDHFFASGHWEWYYLSYTSGVFIGAYFISRYVIRKFIIYRIKPIYQIATSYDMPLQALEDRYIKDENMLEDIGERVLRWAAETQKERELAKQTEDYQREYLGNVSHELKTPVFNIHGFISTLLEGDVTDPDVARKFLERADKNVERLIQLLGDLDLITKLESELSLNVSDFDISELAHYSVEITEHEAENNGMRLIVEYDKDDGPLMVTAEKKLIEQVFVNLLTNSIHYGHKGGTTRISFTDLFEKIMIEVTDDGIGIDEKDLSHIFERFYRVDKSRSVHYGGRGLGLPIVKRIINSHGERIYVRSQPGKGTTFTFYLPKAEYPDGQN